jgi:hypothetical protein
MATTHSPDDTTTRTKHRPLLVALVVILIVAVGGIAFAYWSSGGSGTGSAKTGTSTSFTVTSTPATSPELTPGGPSQSVAFNVANPSTGTQTLTSVVVTVANADGSAWTAVPGCSAADYLLGTPAVTYGTIAPGGSVSGTVPLSMNNLASNQDACKNVTVPLYFVAS